MMAITRRRAGPGDLRRVQEMTHELWRTDPSRLNFETSFGTLAWEGADVGRERVFERDGALVAWARLTPGYDRIRQMGVRDTAPANLVWAADWREPANHDVINDIVAWAEARSEEPFTTSHAVGDEHAAAVLAGRGYVPDSSEPFGIYLQQPLTGSEEPRLDGYRFTTMADVDDLELRRRGPPSRLGRVHPQRRRRRRHHGAVALPTRPRRHRAHRRGRPRRQRHRLVRRLPCVRRLEPVGSAAAHRGRGVGAALLRFGLARLHAAGATHAVVGARGDDDYPVPRRLYASVGFQQFSVQQIVRKPQRLSDRPHAGEVRPDPAPASQP